MGDASAGDSFATSSFRLSALSADAIHSIAWYLNGPSFFYLICTGDSVLRAKLRQTRSLTVSWQNSSYCKWNQCLPFIATFPEVQELCFRTNTLLQLSYSMLDFKRLPSNLKTLELRFRGALDLLRIEPKYHASKDFTQLVSLQTLIIEQQLTEEGSDAGRFDLGHLPPNLEHLHILVPGKTWYRHSVSDWRSLPTSLRSYSVLLEPEMSIESVKWVSFGTSPQHLPNLTHLSVVAPMGCYVDIKAIASTLKSLKVHGAVSCLGQPLFISQLDETPIDPLLRADWAKELAKTLASRGAITGPLDPVRTILPHLESLELPTGLRVSWDIFETLPLSMTRLHVDFEPLGAFGANELASRLNRQFSESFGEDRPFAPLLLRSFSFPNGSSKTLHMLLKHFVGLDSVHLENTPLSAEQIPPLTRSVAVMTLEGDLSRLPLHLTSLRCIYLESPSPSDAPSSLVRLPQILAPLTSLFIALEYLTVDMIDALPVTLEQLSACFETNAALKALKTKADDLKQLPALTSLSLQLPSSSPDPIIISLETIPSTITSLQLRGETPQFVAASTGRSLRHHPSLTNLNCDSPQFSDVIFGQLPSQLLHLIVRLAYPIDLNDDLVIDALLSIPPRLRSLSILSPSNNLGQWLLPLRRRDLTLSKKLLLAGKHRSHLGLMLAVPSSLWTERLSFLVSQNFVLSCLPPSLVELKLDLAQSYPYEVTGWAHFVSQIIETRPQSIWNGIKRILITRFSLLGLLVQTEPVQRYEPFLKTVSEIYSETRFQRLPPHLSYLDTPTESYRDHHRSFALNRPTMTIPQHNGADWHSRRRNAERIGFHSINLLLMLHYTYLFSIERKTHPFAWYYHWMNIIGSGIAIPMLLRRKGSGALPSSSLGELAIVASIWTLFNWTTGVAGAIALGYASSRWGWVSKSVALFVAIFGESAIQLLIRGVY